MIFLVISLADKFRSRRETANASQKGSGIDGECKELTFDFELLSNGPETTTQPQLQRRVSFNRYRLKHNLANVGDLMMIQDKIDIAYKNAIDSMLADVDAEDIVTVELMQDDLYQPLFISNCRRKNLRATDFLDKVYEVSQSQKYFLLANEFELKLSVLRRLRGGAPRGRNLNQAVTSISHHFDKHVIHIKNNEGQMCGYLALAMGIWLSKNKSPGSTVNGRQVAFSIPQERARLDYLSAYQAMHKNLGGKLRDYAEELFMEICPEMQVNPLGLDELNSIQHHLSSEYQLIVVRRPTTPATKQTYQPMFEGNSSSNNKIILEFVGGVREDGTPASVYDQHYNLVNRLHRYYEFNFWCFQCKTGYQRADCHSCEGTCKYCRRRGLCEPNESTKHCGNCNEIFPNSKCFDAHKKRCNRFQICEVCSFRHRKNLVHQCGWYHCLKCREEYEGKGPTHYCNIKALDAEALQEKDEKLKIIVAFDIESYQKPTRYNSDKYQHVANLLIAHVCCDVCWNALEKAKTSHCAVCGPIEHRFYGDECVREFNDYLIDNLSPIACRKKAQIDVYAHNLKGYDGKFVLRDLMEQSLDDLDIILSGSKILRIKCGNIRFADSLNFFQQRLADLPKSFGFEDKAKKGYFPHFFNQPHEKWTELPSTIPHSRYFGTGMMKPADLENFRAWYNERKETEWNFENEIVDYCSNDCLVLMTAIQEFRRLVKESQGIDPTTRCFTLASVCMETWRANVLGENKIGITPISGYSGRKSSVVSNVWLDMIQKFEGKQIHREQRIGPYWADGFDNDSNTVYEFNGCHYHGHSCEYENPEEIISLGGEPTTPQTLLNKVFEKKQYYESMGMNYQSIWECEFKRIFIDGMFFGSRPSSSSDAIQQNVERETEALYEFTYPLLNYEELLERKHYSIDRRIFLSRVKREGHECNIREAFFGGRTGNCRNYYVCRDDEFLRYVDFTSLYPFVLYSKKFPTGHPTVITEDFSKDADAYFGFMSCSMQPPKKLFMPVLPVRHDNKLIFPLCRSCVDENNLDVCPHYHDERSLTGTWTTVEIYNALKRGYKFVEIFQVYHWDESNQKEGLFSEYIRTWLKIKQESSDWPAWVLSKNEPLERLAAETQYIENYKEKQGIDLDRENIKPNKGLRNLAKLMLNSFCK